MDQRRRDQLKQLSALVVDDNPFMRNLLAGLVRKVGVGEIHVAADGRQAIDEIPYLRPDVIFTDWLMPGVSGKEFVKWVRQSPNSPNDEVPIILITGAGSRPEIRAARDVGVNEFIVKPVSVQTLAARLDTVLNKRRPFVRSETYVGPCRRRGQAPTSHSRRLDDPIATAPGEPPWIQVSLRLGNQVKALREFIAKRDLTRMDFARMFRERTQKVSEFAESYEDAQIPMVANSLIAYVNAVGGTNQIDTQVVEMHLASLDELSRIAPDHPGREELVDGLQKVVAKRLNRVSGQQAARA